MIERIAVAVGTGISVLGFVAFFGGVILFTRFFAAGVPAEDAIAHVPRVDLIAAGAVFLVPAVLTSLAAVTAMAVVDGLFGLFGSRAEKAEAVATREQELEERETAEAAALALVTAERKNLEALSAAQLAVWQDRAAWLETREAAQQQLATAEISYRDAQEATGKAEKRRRRALREQRDAEHVVWRRSIGGLVLLVGEIVIIGPALDVIGNAGDWFLVVMALALTIAGTIVVGIRTRKFTWFALTAFVAVGLFVGIAAYERTKNDTKVSPVALLHDGNIPAYGFFVTETDHQVYIAQPQRKLHVGELKLSDSNNRLLEFKRENVTNLQIGPLVRSERAYRRSLELAASICAVPRVPPKPSDKPPKGTTKKRTAKKQAKASRKAKASRRKQVKKANRPAKTKPKPAPPCDAARAAALKNELNAVRAVDTDRSEH